MANLWTPTQSYSGLSVAYYELRLLIFLVSFCYHVGWNDLQCFCDNFLHVGYFDNGLWDQILPTCVNNNSLIFLCLLITQFVNKSNHNLLKTEFFQLPCQKPSTILGDIQTVGCAYKLSRLPNKAHLHVRHSWYRHCKLLYDSMSDFVYGCKTNKIRLWVQFLCNYSVGLIVHVTNKILAIVQEYGVAGQAILFMKWTSINLSVICKDSIFSDWYVKFLAFPSEVRKICASIRHLGS
jgi:hypothetical protein